MEIEHVEWVTPNQCPILKAVYLITIYNALVLGAEIVG